MNILCLNSDLYINQFFFYSYTEAERIQKTVMKLEKKEDKKFLEERQEKIATQLTHMLSK